MRALAFDQASGITGWAAGDSRQNNLYEFGSIKTPRRDQFGERLAIIFDISSKLIDKYKPDIIGFEEPYFPPISTQGKKRSGRDTSPRRDGWVQRWRTCPRRRASGTS